MITAKTKQVYSDWEQYREALLRDTFVEKESEADKIKRIKRLEANHEEWFKYYFPQYCFAEPAGFHKRATNRLLKNSRWYEVRAWSRELAKTARTMMEVLYLVYTKQARNVLMISSSYDAAENLLKPYKINIESNQRLLNDYGTQELPGSWEDGSFTMRLRASFKAVGAGQSPRGTRNEEVRPDIIIFDDIDTDEEVRNPERIQVKWNWIERAVIPTASVSRNVRIIFCGNIIGKDTCITRAIKIADHADIINIRDKEGKSTWASKNTEAHIDWLLSKMSYASQQQEYFNNPVTMGTVFKSFTWGEVPELSKFKFLLTYTDPSFKEGKKNDYKATWLLGKMGSDYYVIYGFCEQTSTRRMIEWHYEIDDFVKTKTAVYYFMESNFIQDTFLKEFDKVAEEKQKSIHVAGDDRKKPDKFARIESTLEPLVNRGKLIFNEKYKNNPHFKTLVEQFEVFAPGSRAHDDGPDAIEGGVFLINNKIISLTPSDIKTGKAKKSKYKY